MPFSFYELVVLLFLYSFLGWVAETGAATIKEKAYRNRGFASGPFCFVYGVSAVLMTVFLQELRSQPVFLFLGCAVMATGIEWFTGKYLERIKQQKWWDYSNKKWNFGGYICLQYSVLWGILGFLGVYYVNDMLLFVFRKLPDLLEQILVWCMIVSGSMDILGSLLSVYHLEEKIPRIFNWNRWLRKKTEEYGTRLSVHIGQRFARVYAVGEKEEPKAKKENQVDVVELFWLLVIGAFLGDLVETLFCRLTAGVWMSRSSLVWGPFSIVWGLAIALATALLYRERDKSDHSLFFIGTLLGGVYEYVCSVFTEIVFGQVFWDYSEIPFNLGGRINLLYCFFWGIAAVVWIKGLYPKASKLVAWIRAKTGKWLTLALLVFMLVNVVVSMLALARYSARAEGDEPDNRLEEILDERFDDERMKRIYPNALQR